MNINREDITGQRFNHLTAIRSLERGGSWIFRCDCGKEAKYYKSEVITGIRKSCGCMRTSIKHDLTGQKFGRLTPIKSVGDKKWLCQCECGATSVVLSGSLVTGQTKSCGCLKRERDKQPKYSYHGLSDSRTFHCWRAMKSRCNRQKDIGYKNYGGRGIKVCDRWLNSFENFLTDMGLCPSNKHSLDRIDPNGNYEPSNCRWATATTQCNNKRNNHKIMHNGKTLTIAQWCDELNISRNLVGNRLFKGATTFEEIFAPNQGVRAVNQVDLNGRIMRKFPSIMAASKELGIHYQTAFRLCSKHSISTKGYTLEYADQVTTDENGRIISK